MRHPPAIVSASVLAGCLALSAPGARAASHTSAPRESRTPVTEANRRAAIEARHDVALAYAQLPAGSRYEPLGRLEGAEIALLHGQSTFGPLLKPAGTRGSAVSELDQARIDVLRADAARARAAAQPGNVEPR